LSARPDETSIVREPRAASQSRATTAATHQAGKAADDLPAALILLTLRRHRNETQRNNAAALTDRRELSVDRRCRWLLAPMTKSHKIVNTPTATRKAEMAGLVHLVVFGKDALLAAVLVFQLDNFGRDTF
jgi:hypothetical protein